MAVVGRAEVLVAPTFKGFQKDVSKEMAQAGGAGGKSAASGFGSSLAKWGKRGAVTAGVGIAAGFGTALVKGFGRLTAIENAQAKLRGLGHDAQTVETIMTNANAAVKGTAFGLGDAATAAAGAVASGIKPGKELERTLTVVGDAAAIAGIGFDEMAAIFNKVSASGIIQGEELAQLGDRGIPILQLLSEELGVSAQEVRKLASEGKVSFADFQSAMESGMGGAAQKSGETFQGALANVGAALGRIGANLLGGVFPKIAPMFQNLIEWMGPLEDAAKRAGETFGTVLARGMEIAGDVLGEVKDGITAFGAAWEYNDGEITSSGLPGFMERVGYWARQTFDYVKDTVIPTVTDLGKWLWQNREAVIAVAAGLGAALVAFKAIMFVKRVTVAIKAARVAVLAFNAALRANPIGLIVTAIGVLVAALVYLYRNNETARRIIDAAWSGIKAGIDAVVGWFRNTAWPWMRDALQWIGDKASWLWNEAISPAFSWIADKGREVFGWIKDTGYPWVRDALQWIGDKAAWLWDKGIKGPFDKIKAGASAVKDAFVAAKDGIGRAWDTLHSLVSKPIIAVIKFVNDKFIGGLNWLFDKIPGVDLSIPLIPVPDAPNNAPERAAGRFGMGRYADGGRVAGYSPTPTADNIPAMLTAGEYVLPVNAVRRLSSRFGAGFLESLRRGMPGYASGGPVKWTDFQKKIKDTRQLWILDKAPGFSIGKAADAWNGITDLEVRSGWVGTGGKLPQGRATASDFGVTGIGTNTPGLLGNAHYGTGRILLNSGARHRTAAQKQGTASHEIGHVLGMMHPSRTDALMSAVANRHTRPTSFDKSWLKSMYPPLGDGDDDNGGGIGGWFSRLLDPFKAIKDKVSGLLSGIGNSWAGQAASGALTTVGGQWLDWVKAKLFGEDPRMTPGGMSSVQIRDLVKSVVPGARMTSGYRPGAVTKSGFKSYHAMGRAADFVSGNMLQDFLNLRNLRPWREAYYSPAGGMQMRNGRPYNTIGTPAYRDHFDHFHLAMNQGGMVKPLVRDQGGIIPPGLSAIYNGTGRNEYALTHEQASKVGSGALVGQIVFQGARRDEMHGMLGDLNYELHRIRNGSLHEGRAYA